MDKINFVYFDVGGVVIRDFSDTGKWEETIDYLGVSPDKRQLFLDLYKQYDDRICLGMPIDGWLDIVKGQLGIDPDPGFSFLRYFVDHFSANQSLWPLLDKLRRHAKVGLLTDMYPGMLSLIKEQKLLPAVEWDVVIDSTEVSLRKPMPEIYSLAAELAGVPPSQILFVDNRQKNLDPAAAQGWQTYLYDSRDYLQATRELSYRLEELL